MIESPLNYTGGKGKILNQMLPLFPKNINCFVDLFCGGCNVGLNVDAKKVVYNDYNKRLVGLYNLLKTNPKEKTIAEIYRIIEKYGLSLVSKNGYKYYNCESSNGLGNYNRDKYNKLRSDFNKMKESDKYYLYLFVLIVYAFNNQIRFNNKGEFNLPVGKRDFNTNIEKKLINFIDKIQCQNCSFNDISFIDFNVNTLDSNDFVYVDPPYLITCATYNERDGWTEENERKLLIKLDEIDKKQIHFALSNVIEAKGKTNLILKEWIKSNPKYKVHKIVRNYSNANYQRKAKFDTSEVLVVNY